MTQIIERVARVIDPEAWSDWKHPPRGMEGFDQKYRDIAQKNRQRRSLKQAQAALKEIKFEQMKDVLENLVLAANNTPIENDDLSRGLLYQAASDAEAFLNELEKTDGK